MIRRVTIVAVAILSVFFLVSTQIHTASVGSAVSRSQEEATEEWRGALVTRRQRSTRDSYFVVPLRWYTASPQTSLAVGAAAVFRAFYEMYPDALPPDEFPSHWFSEESRTPGVSGGTATWTSILLTMAAQEGYTIEHVTNDYVILRKAVPREQVGGGGDVHTAP